MKGKILEDLSIDCVIFGFQGSMQVLLVRHKEGISKGKWALPGGFVMRDESLDEAAYRILYKLTGIRDLFLEQTKAFGAVDRFPTKRVVTVAYQALVRIEELQLKAGFTADDVKWVPFADVPQLPYDHPQILSFSQELLRMKIRQEPIGFKMLPKNFTLHQLQSLYEDILGVELDKPNFRRKIERINILIATGEKEQGVSHRAAKLYRFDPQAYQSLKERKFILD
ncbi:MAG: NUDIX domain-containing protein, partial [Bacteroidota bacterium]